MEHLYILSPLSDKPGEYFLPCILPMATTTDLENIRQDFKEKANPLVMAWIDDDDEPKPLPQDLFPALVVNLLSCNSSPNFNYYLHSLTDHSVITPFVYHIVL